MLGLGAGVSSDDKAKKEPTLPEASQPAAAKDEAAAGDVAAEAAGPEGGAEAADPGLEAAVKDRVAAHIKEVKQQQQRSGQQFG